MKFTTINPPLINSSVGLVNDFFFFSGQDNPGLPTHLYADDPHLSCSASNLTS